MPSAAKTLVLFADYTTRLSYYDDWADAFSSHSAYDATSINLCSPTAEACVRSVVREAELIVLLHSTNGDTTTYLEPIAPILADRAGKLVAFIGNEVNLPGSPISEKRRVLGLIGPDYVATQLLQNAGEFLWGDLVRKRVIALPHALNPAAFKPELPDDRRPIDIGVRAVQYLPHLGDQDRNRLHDFFAEHAFCPNLNVDISNQRFDRAGWANFLNRCKGTVSSEAGTWFIERDDATIEAIRQWTFEKYRNRLVIANDSPLRRLGHCLPWWARSAVRGILSRGLIRHEATVNEELHFDEVYNRFFRDRLRPEIHGKCISSRHFDAIGTRTCQILLEGRYNDILVADEDYICLRSDFSNIAEVMERFRNPAERQRIADNALARVLDRHTYQHRVSYLYDVVNQSD